jgi:hypothetical protein
VSLAQTLSTYLTLNLLIVVGFAAVRSISFWRYPVPFAEAPLLKKEPGT